MNKYHEYTYLRRYHTYTGNANMSILRKATKNDEAQISLWNWLIHVLQFSLSEDLIFLEEKKTVGGI